MEITHKIYVPIERNDFEYKYLSKNIPYLYLGNYKRVFYYLNEIFDKHAGKEIQLLTMKESLILYVIHV